MIKVCIDPMCEEVAHHIDKKETRCRSCDGIMVEIGVQTYREKFMGNFFQYDYRTYDLVTPVKMGFTIQMQLFT
jgi:hypothetical protein